MNKKSWFALFVLGLFVASFLISSVGVVSAATPQDAISKFFTDIGKGWASGTGFSLTFAKVLLGVIVVLLVYSVADKLPGLSGQNMDSIRWLLSIIVGFLGTAYFTPNDVFSILLSYSGMGFALGIILPFLILAYFSYDILQSEKSKMPSFLRIKFVQALWLAFVVYIFSKLVGLFGLPAVPQIQSIKISIYLIIIVGVLFMFFAGWSYKVIKKWKAEEVDENAGKRIRKAARATENLSAFQQSIGGVGDSGGIDPNF